MNQTLKRASVPLFLVLVFLFSVSALPPAPSARAASHPPPSHMHGKGISPADADQETLTISDAANPDDNCSLNEYTAKPGAQIWVQSNVDCSGAEPQIVQTQYLNICIIWEAFWCFDSAEVRVVGFCTVSFQYLVWCPANGVNWSGLLNKGQHYQLQVYYIVFWWQGGESDTSTFSLWYQT